MSWRLTFNQSKTGLWRLTPAGRAGYETQVAILDFQKWALETYLAVVDRVFDLDEGEDDGDFGGDNDA